MYYVAIISPIDDTVYYTLCNIIMHDVFYIVDNILHIICIIMYYEFFKIHCIL